MERTLEQIYEIHRQALFSLALSITGSTQSAEDAVHNAFTKLVQRPVHADDAVAYVFKSVRNASLDSIRVRQRRERLHESLFKQTQSDSTWQSSAYDTIVTQEQSTLLQTAIDQLPANDRESIVLKAIAGLTFEQAGKVTGLPAKTIATRYRRALQKLQQQFDHIDLCHA